MWKRPILENVYLTLNLRSSCEKGEKQDGGRVKIEKTREKEKKFPCYGTVE